MPVTPSQTRDQIQDLINQIVAGGSYTADELRPLLSIVLGSIYGPFYSATSNPSTSNNQTQNYKTGSLGKNSSTGRYFVCSSATASAATWEQVSIDLGIQNVNYTSAGQSQSISNNRAVVIYSGTQDNTTVNLPAADSCYTGKRIKVFFSSPAQNTGLGVSFFMSGSPTPISINGFTQNQYSSSSTLDFVFNGSNWSVCQVSSLIDTGYQNIVSPSNGGTTTAVSDTHILRFTLTATVAAHSVVLPAIAYIGKVIKIMVTSSTFSITSLDVKRSDGTSIGVTALGPAQAIELFYTGTGWSKVVPTVAW